MFTVAMDPATMNRGRVGTHVGLNHAASSPESAVASELFDQFVAAGTFKAVLSTFRQICEVLRIKPTNFPNFYPRLKAKLRSWKAASLWSKIDKRASHKCYNRGKACPNTRILIIGAGPCGLRTAIEAQLLGAKVVVIEKRDRFSRNNVLHLWPFVIHDLRNLGAKKFFGKFCAGAIDHISIRQLQLILLKVALLLGVEVHENVSFKELLEPPEDQSINIGWRAAVLPSDHPVHQYEFDVLIGADGKRNTLNGFNRKEFRGKLAIAVTANFINRHTMEEARIPEISGVAFIFNQKFFQDMKEQTGIDLENIVYYKDDTHYFVMTAKKQSLLERGVIIKDFSDTARLLAPENVDREALMEYARDAADFATNYQMPHLEFAVNHYGQADVAMFDFTSMYAAESASRVCERRGHRLLQGLVGDSLLEPFWPTGSGCARGFLSAFDAAWMIRSWASGKMSPSQVLAERESVYRLLAQTTPENLSKDFNKYSLNPASRYPNLNTHAVLPSQIRMLYDSDSQIKDQAYDVVVEVHKPARKRRDSIIHPDALQAWCQQQVLVHEDIKIKDMSESWKNGMALCAIIHHYRPDLIDLKSLNPDDAAKNNQLAFDICEREFGIPPIMTGQEMADCDVPDTLAMVSYISQIYETFRGEIPYIIHPSSKDLKDITIEEVRPPSSSALSILSKIGHKLQNKRRYSLEREGAKDKAKNETLKRSRIASALISKRRSRDKDKGVAVDLGVGDVLLTHYSQTKPIGERPSFTSRIQTIEEKLLQESGLRAHQDREETETASSIGRSRLDPDYWNVKMLEEKLRTRGAVSQPSSASKAKVGRIQKEDWNVKMLEERLKQKEKAAAAARDCSAERPKVMQEIFENKLQLMDARLKAGGGLTAEEEVKYGKFDQRLKQLDQQLREGSNLDVGVKGSNWVSAMAEHMAAILENKPSNRPLPPVAPAAALSGSLTQIASHNSDASAESSSGGSEICYFCRKRVYLMERLSAQGLFFHRSCFRCEYCNTNLRLQHYAFDPTGACGGKFYCYQHFRKQKPDARWQEMMRRKEAFLSGELDRKESVASLSSSPAQSSELSSISPKKEAEAVREVPEIKVTQAVTTKQANITEKDSTIPVKQPTTTPIMPHLLAEPSLSSLRDRTPERVEYENSLELSEEELLTSELEEEELTQKNLGSVHEVATSEDEYSDLSTDSESEEEAYAEELERSLTADETRKLAESWKKRYSKEPTLPNKEGSSEESDEDVSSVSDESATETGSGATSSDVDSDAEYSTEEEEAHEGLDLEKTPVQEKDLLKCLSKTPGTLSKTPSTSESDEETSDLDESEGPSDSDVISESEEDSEPEPEPLKHQIPTIIIEESPPQDNVDEDWAETAAAVLQESEAKSKPSDNIADDDASHHPKNTQPPYQILNESEKALSDMSPSSSSINLGSLETLATSISEFTDNKTDNEQAVPAVETLEESPETNRSIQKTKDEENVQLLVENAASPNEEQTTVGQIISVKNLSEENLISLELSSEKEHPQPPVLISPFENRQIVDEKNSGTSPGSEPGLEVEKSKDLIALSENSSPGTSGGCLAVSEDSFVAASNGSSTAKSHDRMDSSSRMDNDWINVIQSPIASCSGTDRAVADSYSGPPDYRKVFSSSDESDMISSINNALRMQGGASSEMPASDSGDLHAQTDSNHQSPSDSGDTTNISYELSSDSTENIGKSTDQNLTPEGYAGFGELAPAEPLPICGKPGVIKISPNGNHVLVEEQIPEIVEPRKGSTSSSTDDIKDLTDIDNLSDRMVCPVQSLGVLSEPDADEITHSDWAKDDLISSMEEFEDLAVDPSFITVRKKNKKTPARNIFIWDEDDDFSLSLYGDKADEDILINSVPNDLSAERNSLGRSRPDDRSNKENGVEAKSTNKSVEEMKVEKTTTAPINIKCSPLLDVSKMALGLGTSTECPPSLKYSPAKFQGYSGSFAEKVRPRSLVGDSAIYLKSLNINLQKMDFPLLSKQTSSGQLNTTNENLNQENKISNTYDEYNKNRTTENSKQPSEQTLPKQRTSATEDLNNKALLIVSRTKRHRIASQGESSVSSSTSDHSDNTNNKNSTTPSFVVRQNKRQHMRDPQQRLSVHDVECVPFADEELRSFCEDLSSPDEGADVFHSADSSSRKPVFQTPLNANHPKNCSTPVNQMNIMDEIRLQRTAEQERARQQARERARLKSDEELGLSPKNYRKKYGKIQPSMSHYEELVSGDFLDEVGEGDLEEEVMDSMLESPFLVKRVDIVGNDAQQSNSLTVNAAKQGSAFTPESSEETTASSKSRLSAVSPGSVELLSVLETASSSKTSPTTDTSKTDGANYLESSISVDDIDLNVATKNATLPSQVVVTSASTSKGATSESSPEITDAIKMRVPFPTRPKVKVTPDPESMEKPKTPSKKNFFSLLSFGKNNSRDKKEKIKEMDKERSASLPADLAKKTPPKERSFPRLKLPRSREKSRDRHKKKYQMNTDESGKSGNSSRESILDEKPTRHVDFSPTPPLKLFFDSEPAGPTTQLLHLNPLANGIAPKASEDSFSDTDDETIDGKGQPIAGAIASTSLTVAGSSLDKREKAAGSKEAKAQRVVQKVHRQQELKRLRAAQEIQRHLEELEIKQRELEERGVEVEKALRGEGERVSLNKSDTELMQDWFDLVHEKSKILREEQELLIRAKDLELEDRHSRLQQDMRERMARDDAQKSQSEIEEEGKILAEMLEIVEKRDELVAMLDQLRVKEVEEDKNFESKMVAKGLQFTAACKS